jgi:peroxiredoxin
MTHPLVVALEEAFQAVRDQDWPLSRRLQVIADEVRTKGPEFASAVDTFVARLESAQAGQGAPKVGEPMPGFTLPDQDGNLVSLDEVLKRGPALLAFHRGHWCPYCRLNMVGLAEIEKKVAPAQIFAISAELAQYTRQIRAEAGAGFPFLSDLDGGYALSINLAILVDQMMAGMIAAAGWNIPAYQGGQAWIHPIPAVFIVDTKGIVRMRHVDPDYRRRMELDDIVAGVGAIEPVRHG